MRGVLDLRLGGMAVALGAALLMGCASQTPAADAPDANSQRDAAPGEEARKQGAERDSSYAKMPPLAHDATRDSTQDRSAQSRSTSQQQPATAAEGAAAKDASETAASGSHGPTTLSLDLGAMPAEGDRHGALSGHRHRPAALPGRDRPSRLGAQQIARIVRRQRKLFQRCYEARLKMKEPLPSGGLGLSFEIGPSGDVLRATAEGRTGKDEKLSRCLTNVLRAIKFPPPAHGGNVVIRYPIL